VIYLEEILNLIPASPETLDRYCAFAAEKLVPACHRLGCRLLIAWYNDLEWFCQVRQLLEFENMEALKAFRRATSHEPAWGEYVAGLEEFAPVRNSRLLEPLAPVWPDILHRAAAESQQTPVRAYSLAILEVAPNQWNDFVAGLSQPPAAYPIIASWRPLGGSPNEVIDLWKGALRLDGYQPVDETMRQFFRNLRPRAPKERLVPVFSLPYSQLL